MFYVTILIKLCIYELYSKNIMFWHFYCKGKIYGKLVVAILFYCFWKVRVVSWQISKCENNVMCGSGGVFSCFLLQHKRKQSLLFPGDYTPNMCRNAPFTLHIPANSSHHLTYKSQYKKCGKYCELKQEYATDILGGHWFDQ